VAAAIGINALAIVMRIEILEHHTTPKAFADPFHWYLGCHFAYCVFANVVLSCKKRCSNTRRADIEEFDAVGTRSLISKTGDVHEGIPETTPTNTSV
jgi:hypothetical protein